MGFLDNSGDIILDAVLTDTGRFRLAKGDGSFRIAKFGLGDDEIDYNLYNNQHASGSAYYDLEILQTPVLEAFTDNAASMRSKLITIPRTNLLYLPVMVLNEKDVATQTFQTAPNNNVFLVAVDQATEESTANQTNGTPVAGVLRGESLDGNFIRLDQGLDTSELSPAATIDSELLETQYIIEMDNRFGFVIDINGNRGPISFIDDDNIATYFLSENTDSGFVKINPKAGEVSSAGTNPSTEVIKGPKGTIINFRIQSSLDLNTSTFLFTKLGSTTTVTIGGASVSVRFIDTIIKVTGATTGYRVDIPVRFIKKI
tara:strand:- start:1820 stop:2764 length:945 start_codon:yes stop_codon:yes gene_type:complete